MLKECERRILRYGSPGMGVLLSMLVLQPAGAATLCVNPSGSQGCYSTINAAVSAAHAHDGIKVAPGTYHEDVVIGKTISLIGTNSANTIIDATGQPNGVYVDGLDNPGLSDVVVTGFTIQNANFEGVLITNASGVLVYRNVVRGNDKSLDISTPACPGLPAFETAEDEDCGEGIHLVGADHSTINNNTVQANSGGILLSDETASTHDNLISGNAVMNNPYDCGITLASHPPAQPGSPFGVMHNTVASNTSTTTDIWCRGRARASAFLRF